MGTTSFIEFLDVPVEGGRVLRVFSDPSRTINNGDPEPTFPVDVATVEDELKREIEAQVPIEALARHKAAVAATHVANLALLRRDCLKASSFCRKALAAQPDHAEARRILDSMFPKAQ